MKLKLTTALILAAIGTSAYATCQYTPQGCPAAPSSSTSTSSAVGGRSSSTSSATGGTSSATGGSVRNSGNSRNTNRNLQGQAQKQHQSQVARGGKGGKGGNATGGAGGAAAGGTGVGSQGQSLSVDSHVEATKRAAASAYAAPLTSSNDTCMGSTSAGLQAPGFGISGGSTWTDKNCVMLKNSRELWNMGLKEAALARMCMDSDNKEAIELSGIHCPVRKTDVSSGPSMTSSTSSSSREYNGNDNIIRKRLGLPLVKE